MTKKNRASTAAFLLLFGSGLLLLLYPSFANWWNSLHQSRAIAAYTQQVSQLDRGDYTQYWEDAQTYNRLLWESGNAAATPYEALLDPADSGIMGYVEIPSIDCVLPIRHGSSEAVLRSAAGHLEWSSLPVGGASSHCVISGHRGLSTARLFTDLDKLVIGDVFHLQVLGNTLTYQVDQILTVLPHETQALQIEPGQDYCTLLTCTPYAVNTHRLLVRGRRVESPPPDETATSPTDVPLPPIETPVSPPTDTSAPPRRVDPSLLLALIFLLPLLCLFLCPRRTACREEEAE